MTSNGAPTCEDEFALIETMRWEGGVRLLDLHLHRLGASSHCLGFSIDQQLARLLVEECGRALPRHCPHKLRLELSRDGQIQLQATAIDPPEREVLRLGIAKNRLHSADPLLSHKTTRRGLQDEAFVHAIEAGLDEVLFLNEREEVCEGSRTNILVRRGEAWYTPARRCGLLPGVYREHLMREYPEMKEIALTVKDVLLAERVYVCNAVWGLRPARLAEGTELSSL